MKPQTVDKALFTGFCEKGFSYAVSILVFGVIMNKI